MTEIELFLLQNFVIIFGCAAVGLILAWLMARSLVER